MMLSKSLVFLVFVASPIFSANDFCAELSVKLFTKTNVTAQSVNDCYQEFAFSKSIQNQTMTVVDNIMSVYAFTDIVNDSPNPDFQPNYDILKRFEAIKNKVYNSDFEFHQELDLAFVPLNDGHTVYRTQCYRSFSFLQPFFLSAKNNQGEEPTVFIHSLDKDFPDIGRNLTAYIGAQVVGIDGNPTAQHLQKHMDATWGVSKDRNTRFNRALANRVWDSATSAYVVSRGAFCSRSLVPSSDSITWTLLPAGSKTTVDVEVPWQVKSATTLKTFSNKDEYWKRNCIATGGDLEEMRRVPPAIRKLQPTIPQQEILVPAEKLITRRQRGIETLEPLSDPVPVVTGPGFAFFVITDDNAREGAEKTGVYAMTSFDSPDEKWRNQMIMGFTELKKQGVTKVILDLSNNGGGIICTAYTLLELLIPGRPRAFLSDMRLSPILTELIKESTRQQTGSIFIPYYWNKDDGTPYSNLTWIDPSRTRSQSNGSKMPYGFTQLFRDQCSTSWGDYKLPYSIDDFVFLTNGYCASSCSLVHNQLHEFAPEIETMVTSAFSDAVTVSTIPGGQVYRASYMKWDMEDAKMDGSGMKLPLIGDVYFTLREVYSRLSPEEIIEYMRVNSNVRLDWVHETAAIWKKVRQEKGWLGFSENKQQE